MIKRFPSRNQRSKGIKVKHVLQIILLVGVCFWLIFQVKHNHDKKKEFAKNDAKLLVSTQTDEILKLGRRDLHPGKNEVNQNEKHEEEDEDEHIEEDEENKHDHNEQGGNKHEIEEREDNKHERRQQEKDENKHRAEEQEEDENKSEDMEDENKSEDMEDENKSEDMEDEGRGGRDGELDENDQEKSGVDTDRDEFLDEEKEKEDVSDEKDDEKEDEEKEGLVENHDNHEAREEHYKGDDASSAVAHDTQAISTETGTFSLESSDVNLEMNITKPENKSTYSDESNRNPNDSDLKVTEGEVIDRISLNATAGKETENSSLSYPVHSLYLNKTAILKPEDNHLESSSNLIGVIAEASSNLTGAGDGADNSGLSERNKTVILSESDHAQNTTVNTVKKVQIEGLEQSGNRISEENLPETNSTVSATTKNGDGAAQESSNLGAGELEKTNRYVASSETVNISRNESSDTYESDKSKGNTETSETNETQNVHTTEDEMFKDTQTGETDETSDSSSANEILDSIEHDAIDSSDTHIHEDVTEARTDLDTLPDIRNEGDNGDDTASE